MVENHPQSPSAPGSSSCGAGGEIDRWIAENLKRNLAALNMRDPALVSFLGRWTNWRNLILFPANGGGFGIAEEGASGLTALSEGVLPTLKAETWAKSKLPGPSSTEPFLMHGVRAGYELSAVIERLTKEPGGKWQACYVLEESPDLFKAALKLHDFSDPIRGGQVRFFIGPDACDQLSQFLKSDLLKPVPKNVNILGGSKEHVQRTVESIKETMSFRARHAQELKKKVDEAYNRLALPDWIRELSSDGPLRILLIDNPFSFYIGYSNRDVAAALQRMGHEVEVISEKELFDSLNGNVLLEALDRFRPHLVHQIDYVRKPWAHIYPKELPFVSCIQDFLPQLLKKEIGNSVGAWDFMTGFVDTYHRHGYRADRLMPMPPCSNPDLFFPLTPDAADIKRYGCDASFVSNISKRAEEYFEELKNLPAWQDTGFRNLAREMYQALLTAFQNEQPPLTGDDYFRLYEWAAKKAGARLDQPNDFIHYFFDKIGNSLFRHGPLIQLSEMGLDLKIYGRGWEKHPKLSRHAMGVAVHGDEMNRIFAASKINLHINHFGTLHNRLVDGCMAGAFFLVRKHLENSAFDLSSVVFSSRQELREKVERFLGDPEGRRTIGLKNRKIALSHYTYDFHYRRLIHFISDSLFIMHIKKESQNYSLPINERAFPARTGKENRLETLISRLSLANESNRGGFARIQDTATNFYLCPDEGFRELCQSTVEIDCRIAEHLDAQGQHDEAAGYWAAVARETPMDRKLFEHVNRLNDSISPHRLNAVNRRCLVELEPISVKAYENPFGGFFDHQGNYCFVELSQNLEKTTRLLRLDVRTGGIETLYSGRGLRYGCGSQDGSILIPCLGDGGIYQIQEGKGTLVIPQRKDVSPNQPVQVVETSDNRILAVYGRGPVVGVEAFDHDGRSKGFLIPPGKHVLINTIHTQGKRLFVADKTSELFVYDIDTGEKLEQRTTPVGKVISMTTDGDDMLIAGEFRGEMFRWNDVIGDEAGRYAPLKTPEHVLARMNSVWQVEYVVCPHNEPIPGILLSVCTIDGQTILAFLDILRKRFRRFILHGEHLKGE